MANRKKKRKPQNSNVKKNKVNQAPYEYKIEKLKLYSVIITFLDSVLDKFFKIFS